jgi:pyridoxine 5-phosphate synthase
MIRLGVNIDHIATVREARKGKEPDPVQAAFLAELGGADGITVHLRSDRRHIRERDVELLKKTIKVPLNVEMAATSEMKSILLSILPYQITLVPERADEITTEGGLDLIINQSFLRDYIKELEVSNINISVFIDPDKEQIKAAHKIGVSRIEINTTKFSETENPEDLKKELLHLKEIVKYAKRLGLRVFAGHGLNYRNILYFRELEDIEEVNIGHSIIARSLFTGLEDAVREMKTLLNK